MFRWLFLMLVIWLYAKYGTQPWLHDSTAPQQQATEDQGAAMPVAAPPKYSLPSQDETQQKVNEAIPQVVGWLNGVSGALQKEVARNMQANNKEPGKAGERDQKGQGK